MTEAELMRIDIALETVGGNRAQAAAILDIPPKSLNDTVRNNTHLRKKWMVKKPVPGSHTVAAPTEAPTVLETMMSLEVPTPSIPPVSPEHQALIPIIDDADRRLSLGLEMLGLSETEINQAVDMVNYHAEHANKTVHLFGAHLVKRGIKLSKLAEQLEEEIKSKDFRDIYSADGSVLIRSGQESKFDLVLRCYAELRKMVEFAHTAAMAREKMKLWQTYGSTNPNGEKPRKPGFAPLKRATLVNVQPGGTVNLHDGRLNGKDPNTNGAGLEAAN